MIGAYTIGKKAVKFGYKRYGVPGAVATGGAAMIGYVAVKRALKSSADGENVDSAIDAGTIKSAVDEKGLSAVTDVGTLNEAVDERQLDSDVDMDEVASSADDETDEMTSEESDDVDAGGGAGDGR